MMRDNNKRQQLQEQEQQEEQRQELVKITTVSSSNDTSIVVKTYPQGYRSCACGCGTLIQLRKGYSKIRFFKAGHQNRGRSKRIRK